MVKPPERSRDDPRPPSAAAPRDGRRLPHDGDAGLDPYLQLVLALIDANDWRELEFRTGIRLDAEGKGTGASLLVGRTGRTASGGPLVAGGPREGRSRRSARLFQIDRSRHPNPEYVTARIALDPGNPALIFDGKGRTLREQLGIVLDPANSVVDHLELAVSHQPCLEESLQHIGLPIDRTFKGKVLKGHGVIVGIIDDGCAFAHRHFLSDAGRAGWGTRILSLWDQSQKPTPADTGNGWTIPADFKYGRELRKAAIDPVINANVSATGAIAEDAVYEYFRYAPGAPDDLSTHGTHVMDIAAGNGNSLMGWEGVAPEADIVFVQLPPVDILNPGPALSKAIADGMAYIFSEAKSSNRPAVVNLSMGGNHGPHDESWHWARLIDHMLTDPNRAVVVAAGNGFEQDTHAGGILLPGQKARLPWIVKPEDPTSNDVEVWYNRDAALDLALTAPDGLTHYGPYGSGTSTTPLKRPGDGKTIGHIAHGKSASDKRALITLRPTQDAPPGSVGAPAPAGSWTITLHNTGSKDARFDAWIQRDDVGKLGGRRQQSRFGSGFAYPGCTICDYAAGKRTISVGAFNVGTQEVSRYSACGPTRARPARPGRMKPDICAPAEENAAGGGILSASSRQAQPYAHERHQRGGAPCRGARGADPRVRQQLRCDEVDRRPDPRRHSRGRKEGRVAAKSPPGRRRPRADQAAGRVRRPRRRGQDRLPCHDGSALLTPAPPAVGGAHRVRPPPAGFTSRPALLPTAIPGPISGPGSLR